MSDASFTLTGVDMLPATDCATFLQQVHDHGLTISLTSVPYPNGGTADTVTENLTR